jgi:monothiol glutaredoxin
LFLSGKNLGQALFWENMMSTQDVIKEQVTKNKVMLYMKGSPDFPQCGFSANAVNILRACGVEDIASVNVLENPDIRQGIKEFSNWPTIPQLYVNGEFVGGSDIVTEMYQSGELQKLFK